MPILANAADALGKIDDLVARRTLFRHFRLFIIYLKLDQLKKLKLSKKMTPEATNVLLSVHVLWLTIEKIDRNSLERDEDRGSTLERRTYMANNMVLFFSVQLSSHIYVKRSCVTLVVKEEWLLGGMGMIYVTYEFEAPTPSLSPSQEVCRNKLLPKSMAHYMY